MDNKYSIRKRRHNRFLKKYRENSSRPRVIVYRSNTEIYAQLIDDAKGHVIAQSSSLKLKSMKPMEKAKKVGESLAKTLKEKNINTIAFDKNSFKYHGKIKALADAMRTEGIIF